MTSKNNLPIYWGPDYVLNSGVETRTKSGPLAKILQNGEIPGLEIIEPLPATREELLVIHDEKYLDRLINGDSDLARSIFASTGGVRDALDAMFEHGRAGSLSSGLHHAKRDTDEGLCYINGLALAALRAISKHGAKKVGVLDTDAHCGGGTFQLVGENEKIFLADVSCNSYDIWRPNSDRHYLEIVKSATEYLDAVQRALDHLEGVDVLIYNAGMDPFEDCSTGGMPGITSEVLEERERLVAQWCEDTQTPAMFVLAGGY
ncbi:MAG: hypothetical protein ACKO6O_08015, partial [Acidimicrobiaceae bacterium]